MRAWRGIAGSMVIALVPPSGQDPGIQSWRELGAWYLGLRRGRRDASPEIKQKVADLTAGAPTMLGKMQALASFVQKDIRYVAIELGIGGHQRQPAAEVFSHRYGDCKDKVTLLSRMLKEIGIESYYVLINTERGSVTAATPPNLAFDHAILAIVLPADLETDALQARITRPKLGKILFFDPTDAFTPLGRLSGALQANFGMRSEEHTSELQSPDHLVCRLLLEKKKKQSLRAYSTKPRTPPVPVRQHTTSAISCRSPTGNTCIWHTPRIAPWSSALRHYRLCLTC